MPVRRDLDVPDHCGILYLRWHWMFAPPAWGLVGQEARACTTMKSPFTDLAPAPNRHPLFPLGGSAGFEYHLYASPSTTAAVGEAQRSP
jgi:hypothetical protein